MCAKLGSAITLVSRGIRISGWVGGWLGSFNLPRGAGEPGDEDRCGWEAGIPNLPQGTGGLGD